MRELFTATVYTRIILGGETVVFSLVPHILLGLQTAVPEIH